MKRTERNINISEIIYKYLHGELADSEEEMLEIWLRETRNMDFFLKIKNTDILYEGMLDMEYVDTDRSFAFLEAKIKKCKSYSYVRYFLGVAAVAVFCFLAVSVFRWRDEKIISNVTIAEEGIRPAGCAKLKIFTGELVYLKDTLKHLNLCEGKVVEPAKVKSQQDTVSLLEGIAYNVLTAPVHGYIQVSLYDGTKVWLNAGSSLKYPNRFKSNKREVYLSGEAFFEVTKDSLRPFRVNTTVGCIDVLGTSFNVNAFDQECCITTLVSGSVKMKSNCMDSVVIYPGQQVILHADGLMNVHSVDVRYYMAWRNNLFAFEDCSLSEIMKTLEEWYKVRIVFENLELTRLRYTTMIKKYDNLDSVLNVLAGVEEFHCKKQAENIFIIKR